MAGAPQTWNMEKAMSAQETRHRVSEFVAFDVLYEDGNANLEPPLPQRTSSVC